MAINPAISNGPIEVTDVNSGRQLSLPISDVYFDGTQIKAKGALYATNPSVFDAFLSRLVAIGAIQPGPEPPTKPVMVIKAKTPGSMGNFIRVQFRNVDA